MRAQGNPKAATPEKIDSVYLYIVDSAFQAEEAWKGLAAAVVPDAAGSAVRRRGRSSGQAGVERIQAREVDAGKVIEHLSTIPMFGGKKLLVVEHVDAWGKEDQAALASFLPRIPRSSCLVLTSSGKRAVETLAKAVRETGKVIEFKAPSQKEAPKWLVEKAREKGKSLSFRAAFLLVEMTGADLQTLYSELEKICTFVGERQNIEPEDVEEAASSQRISSTFELLDQIKAHQVAKAVKSLRGILFSGEEPPRILAMKTLGSLAWNVRMVWQVKDSLRRGMTGAELASRLKANPWAIQKASEQAGRFSDLDLRSIHEAIRRADADLKSKGTPPEVILEALVLDLCLEKQKPSSLR